MKRAGWALAPCAVVLCCMQAQWMHYAFEKTQSPLVFAAQIAGTAAAPGLPSKPRVHDLWHAPLFFLSIALPMWVLAHRPKGGNAIVALFRAGALPINLILRGDYQVARCIGAVLVSIGLLMTMSSDLHAEGELSLVFATALLGGNLAGSLLGVRQEKDGDTSRCAYALAMLPLLWHGHEYELHCDSFTAVITFLLAAVTAAVMTAYFKAAKRQSFKLTLLLTVRRFVSVAVAIVMYGSSGTWLFVPSIFVFAGTMLCS